MTDIEVKGQVGQHVIDLRDEITRLRAQFPEGMQDRRIIFEECEVGHGFLRGENWVKQECPWCQITRLREEIKRHKQTNMDLLDMEATGRANRILRGKALAEMNSRNERLREVLWAIASAVDPYKDVNQMQEAARDALKGDGFE